MDEFDFEDEFYTDEDCTEEMEGLLGDIEEQEIDAEMESIDKQETSGEELLSIDEVFIVGSLVGQAYSERSRFVKAKKAKKR